MGRTSKRSMVVRKLWLTAERGNSTEASRSSAMVLAMASTDSKVSAEGKGATFWPCRLADSLSTNRRASWMNSRLLQYDRIGRKRNPAAPASAQAVRSNRLIRCLSKTRALRMATSLSGKTTSVKKSRRK